MGNKKNSEKWLPATRLRIMAFARSLAPARSNVHLGHEPKASDIQDVLSKLVHPINDISAPTIRSWVVGEKLPSVSYVNWIKQGMPECADWLTPDIDSSPMRRFLCALDIWGSPIESTIRSLDTASTEITVGKGLAILARRWGSVPIVDGTDCFYGFAIPRLKCHVPRQVDSSVYRSSNPLSLMDFMFRCGSYLDLAEDSVFTEWAIDLASLTLMIGAFIEGTSLVSRSQSGSTGVYNRLVHRIFFLPHGNWPNLQSVRDELQVYSEFDDSVIDYPQRLMLARGVLSKNLLSIGCDLSIARIFSERIKDRDYMWHSPLGAHGETFAQSDLFREKRDISPATPRKYRYELQTLKTGERIALCHDLANGTQAPLDERPDLYNGYEGLIGWGYSGSGSTFLAISILAHHLAHDDFSVEEIDRLRNKYISRLPEQLIGTSFFLTTELIDKCLNE